MARKVLFILVVIPLQIAAAIGIGLLFGTPAPDLYDGKLTDPKDYVHLNVPYVRQTSDHDCAKAAISMVLEYHAFPHNVRRLEEEFVGPTGAYTYEALRYIHELGINAISFYPTNSDSVLRLLKAGLPVLISHRVDVDGKALGHMIVLVGAGPNYFVIHDPSAGKDLLLNRHEFDMRWVRNGSWSRRAIAVLPHNITAAPFALEFAELGDVFDRAIFEIGRGKSGLDSLRQVVDRSPTFLPAQLVLALELQKDNQFEESEKLLERIVALDPGFYWGFSYLGLHKVQGKQGRYHDAEATWTEFVKLVKENREMFAAGPPEFQELAEDILNPHNNKPSPLSTTALVRIGSGVIMLAFLGMTFLLHRTRAQPDARRRDSRFVLRAGWLKKILAFFTGLALIFHATFTSWFPFPSLENGWAALFYSLGLAMWGWSFWQRISLRLGFDDAQVYRYSLWSGFHSVLWSEIESCCYSRVSATFILKTTARRRLKIPRSWHGAEDLINRVNRILQPPAAFSREPVLQLRIL